MKISVFLFIIFNVNQVLTNDNVAMESNIAYQDAQKIHSESVDSSENDQIAESSHSIGQTYKTEVLKNIQEGSPNQVQVDVEKNGGHVYDGQNTKVVLQSTEALSHDTVPANNVEILEPALTQGYLHQGQQVYVQYPLHPIRIFGAEASPLYQNQLQESEGQTLGYSSYVEHVSQKDEEEIKSALKEGSMSDIKRLVPKSGISFKIYKNEKNKNLNLENSKAETESTHIPGGYSQYSKLHQKIKTELPATHHNNQDFQAVYKQEQPTEQQEGSQQTYQQHELENSPYLLQSGGAISHSQDHQYVNEQTQYFSQPDKTSQKTFLQFNGKSSSPGKSHFKINLDDNNNYSKATSTAEFNSLSSNRESKYSLSDISNYPKQWSFDTKSEGSQRAVKKLKPTVLQYEIDPVALAERNKAHFTHAGSLIPQNSFNKHKTNFFIDTQKSNGNANFQNAYTGKGNQNYFIEQLGEKDYSDKKTSNLKTRLPENFVNVEDGKQGQNHIVGHLGTNAYADSQIYKGSQSEYFGTTSYPDNEPAKSGQHNIITHIDKNAYVETKNSQNFDHQKALEGSTSFDIKNAIDTAGSLIHQTNHVTPEIHSFDDLNKQQLAYEIRKIPTSTIVLNTGVHDTPAVEGHQIKDFGISPPQLSYHTVSSPEVSGKFFHQPQNVLWSSEHLKQGNTLTANDLHQPLIKLHLPKEEFYQHVKTPNIEPPTSSISHISYQQKQPYVIHYDLPLLKYPQEIHFQPKTKTRIQNQGGNLKLGQPLAIDWSLFKSTFPNFNINSLAVKPELTAHIHETGKKIVPILIRKRINRSNNKQESGTVVYGKVNNKRRPTKPSLRQEKTVRVNLLPEASNNVKLFEPKGERKNEFSVSASYKIDRSFKTH